MNITFIVNSRARDVTQVVHSIHGGSWPIFNSAKVRFTEFKGHGIELSSKMAEWSDLMIAVGGDGTLNEVVNGIMQSGLDPEKRPRLALLPMGSANDFARIQKISPDLEELVDLIEKERFCQVDVGRILMKAENRTHYFINVADSGMGAEVVKRMEEKSIFRRILSSDLRFALAIFRTFFAFKRKKVEILLDNNVSIGGRILTLVVANSSAFGSGLIIAPDAKIDDGKFQLVLGDISLLGYLTNVGRVLKGKRINRPGVQYQDASNIKISGPGDLLTQADGELAGSGNLEIDCIPEAIAFLLPESVN